MKNWVAVFVGCGGTFYAASPYLAVLHRRYRPGTTILIDHDLVEEENYERQWPGFRPGLPKVYPAEELLVDSRTGQSTYNIIDKFKMDHAILESKTVGRPVLAIVNVDNDEARLEVAQWLEDREEDGIMVVSGCERRHGQCYPGVWMGGRPVYDWREHHEDVVTRPPVIRNACNLQNVRANALTGVLVGMCIEDVVARLETGRWGEVAEFYWEVDGETDRVKMWETMAKCREEVASG
jgi:hypothetical protein